MNMNYAGKKYLDTYIEKVVDNIRKGEEFVTNKGRQFVIVGEGMEAEVIEKGGGERGILPYFVSIVSAEYIEKIGKEDLSEYISAFYRENPELQLVKEIGLLEEHDIKKAYKSFKEEGFCSGFDEGHEVDDFSYAEVPVEEDGKSVIKIVDEDGTEQVFEKGAVATLEEKPFGYGLTFRGINADDDYYITLFRALLGMVVHVCLEEADAEEVKSIFDPNIDGLMQIVEKMTRG